VTGGSPGRRFFPAFSVLLCTACLLSLPCRAQEQETGYYLEKTVGKPRFIQRLSWEPEEYASRYEVRMERREEGGNWSPVFERFTGGNFIEISLSPGSYRYRVRAYDLVENPADSSEWVYFEILPAVQPGLESFSPNRISLDELSLPDGRTALTLTVRGRNLTETAEFRLVRLPGGRAAGPETEEAVLPLRRVPGGDSEETVLIFDGRRFFPGDYELHVTNPGGLSDSLGTLHIVPPKKPDRAVHFSVSGGYSPLVPLYGEIHELLEAPVFPAGAYGHFSVLPLRTNSARFGLEAAVRWTLLSSRYKGGALVYDVSSQFLGLEARGLFQKDLTRRLSLNLGLGGGLFSILGFEKRTAGYRTKEVNALVPVIGGGLSLRWFFSEFFFAETGVEYTHVFSVDDPSPGYIGPFAGIGFSR
jgi:hypothetical protein